MGIGKAGSTHSRVFPEPCFCVIVTHLFLCSWWPDRFHVYKNLSCWERRDPVLAVNVLRLFAWSFYCRLIWILQGIFYVCNITNELSKSDILFRGFQLFLKAKHEIGGYSVPKSGYELKVSRGVWIKQKYCCMCVQMNSCKLAAIFSSGICWYTIGQRVKESY